MTEIVQPVPVFDLTVPRGASRVVRFTPTKDGANVDLSLPGIWMVFTVRSHEADAEPAIQKAHATAGAVLPTGVADAGVSFNHIDTNADATPDTWVADVQIDPADTEDVDRPVLAYDMWLRDPSGQEAPCAQGQLKLTPTVLRP